jgi:hypothetical protein
MACVPPVRVEVVNVATPLPLSVPVPSVAAPFLNVTVPVGTGAAVWCTVAVNVTAWPYVDGFSEEASAVVLTSCTTWTSTGEVLARKKVAPK